MCSQIKSGDFYFVTKRSDVEEGDWLHFAGKERVEVYGVWVDFMSDARNSIRIKGKFKSDHQPQLFKISRIPKVKGFLLSIPNTAISVYHPIEIGLSNINEYHFGTAYVRYYNFCFNEMEFLRHDVAISI